MMTMINGWQAEMIGDFYRVLVLMLGIALVMLRVSMVVDGEDE